MRAERGFQLLAHDGFEQAAAEGASVYDLMWGDEAYKWRFAPEARPVRTVMLVGAWRPTAPAWAGSARTPC